MVSSLPARVFAVADEKHLSDWVIILPANTRDLLLPQSGRYGETDDTTDGDNLPWVVLECCEDAIDLSRSGPTVPLVSLADEPKAP